MTRVASENGFLTLHPEDSSQYAMYHASDTLSTQFIEGLRVADERVQFISRSVFGQLGVDWKPVGDPTFIEEANGQASVYLPVAPTPYSEVGSNVVRQLDAMRARSGTGAYVRGSEQDQPIEVGRYIDYAQLKRLDTKAQTEEALQQGLLAVGEQIEGQEHPYTVNEDGSITMPLAFVETLVNPFTLSKPNRLREVLWQGRTGIRLESDTYHIPPDTKVPPFFVGGISLSPGPFTCVIRDRAHANSPVMQLPSAAVIDGNRLMGIGKQLDPYSGHRQVELVNDDPDLIVGEATVTVDIYRERRLSDQPAVIDWYGMPIAERLRLHEHGLNPLKVLQAANPAVRETVKETYNGRHAGILLSAEGAEIVPQGATDKLTADNVQSVAEDFERNVPLSEALEPIKPFVRALKPSGDRSFVFMGRRMTPKNMVELAASADVRTFLIEDFGDVFMKSSDHMALTELVRSGVSVGWDHDGEMRVFHRSGMIMRPEEVPIFEAVELVVAMYGTHRKAIDAELAPGIDRFIAGLAHLVGGHAEKVAVIHGNGPGVMRLSDVAARKAGMQSRGVGILVEGQEEGKDIWLPGAAVQFQSEERLYRQQIMDRQRLVSIINIGGDGTLEELMIDTCTTKLNLTIPAPTVLVDLDGEYLDSAHDAVRKASEQKTLRMNGKDIDISATPLAQPWVINTVHHVRSYDEALAIVERFQRDPVSYWREAGIPAKEVLKGFLQHQVDYTKIGMRVAPHYEQAVMEYVRTH